MFFYGLPAVTASMTFTITLLMPYVPSPTPSLTLRKLNVPASLIYLNVGDEDITFDILLQFFVFLSLYQKRTAMTFTITQ